MAFNNFDRGRAIPLDSSQARPVVEVNPILRWVYAWMTLGMLATFGVGIFINAIPGLQAIVLGNPFLILIAFVVQIGLVMGLSWGIRRMSPGMAAGLFLVYSGSMGILMALIFVAYDTQTIFAALGSTVALFGTMSVFGFLTKMDLTRWGPYLMIGLVALIIAMIINWIIGLDGLRVLISIGGVLLFTALTAYDTQKIKLMAQDPALQNEQNIAFKLSIMGALTLYLDFINLFLFLLSLFGRE